MTSMKMSDSPDKSGQVRRLVGEGARLLAARRPGEAIVVLLEARVLDLNDVTVAINLGGAYIMQGKFDAAVPVLELAAALEPNNVMVWSNLAAAYLGKLPLASPDRQEKAIRAYERALALDPATPHVHYNLALIYLERQDTHRAIAHFYAALETDPSDRDARTYLEKLQRGESGNTREA
jgi:Flp pilus assembly protein TadD